MTDKVDVNQSINGHSITIGWLLNSLRQNDKEFQKLHGNRVVKEVEAYDVSGGKGFASEILRCIIKFEDSVNANDHYTTILKIPGKDGNCLKDSENGDSESAKNDEMAKNLIAIHEFECNFYENLAPIFDVPVPKVYKTLPKISDDKDSDGCIHMEDLTHRGRTMTLFDNISLTQLKHIVRLLAHMHKNILSSNPKIWQGKYLEIQKTMVKIVDMMKPLNESFLKICKSPDLLKPLLKNQQKIAESKEFFTFVISEAYKQDAPVLVHGDLHAGNIMWEIDENGDFQNSVAAFIDWQSIHEGSPMSDLARILTFCCDGATRRKAETFIFDFYLECLGKEFDGDLSKIPYTKVHLKRAYSLAFLIQANLIGGCMAFFYGIIKDGKDYPESVAESLWDQGELKALHALQDSDRLLRNELKKFYEKYGI